MIEGKDLYKPHDFYSIVSLDTERQARTLTKYNTNNPFWSQSYVFDDVPTSLKNVVVAIYKYVIMFGIIWQIYKYVIMFGIICYGEA